MNDQSKSRRASSTDLAEDRTILANERTFAGWMRTALGSIAIGIGFHAFLPTTQAPWFPKAIATVFLLLAIVVILLAEHRAAAVIRRLSPHVVVSARPMNLRMLAAAVTICSLALIAAIWLVELR